MKQAKKAMRVLDEYRAFKAEFWKEAEKKKSKLPKPVTPHG